MTHDEAVELLPWYVNGTLGAGDRQAIEAHLGACDRCAAELGELRALGEEMTDLRAAEPEPSADRLAAVLRRARGPGWWARTPIVARLALAAQLLLAVGLGSWVAALYRDRGEAGTLSGGGGEQARIVVQFQSGVAEADLRRTVQGLAGSIVEGPSALGLYTVALPFPPDSAAAVDRALATLRGDPAVVRFAERAP